MIGRGWHWFFLSIPCLPLRHKPTILRLGRGIYVYGVEWQKSSFFFLKLKELVARHKEVAGRLLPAEAVELELWWNGGRGQQYPVVDHGQQRNVCLWGVCTPWHLFQLYYESLELRAVWVEYLPGSSGREKPSEGWHQPSRSKPP